MSEFKSKREWKLTKIVLPQHTDHAGVMWHGSYFNFLEEGRIDALNKVGISYSNFSKTGFEIPVISLEIKYKLPFFHGEKCVLISQFKLRKQLRLNCKTFFLKLNGDIGAEANVGLVVVKRINQSMKLVRELPVQINNIFLLLEEGPKV